jgi:hypothetical protein
MTDLEKLEARIEAIDSAITATKHASVVDRKLSHDKHSNGHITKALDELLRLKIGLEALAIRMKAVGR